MRHRILIGVAVAALATTVACENESSNSSASAEAKAPSTTTESNKASNNKDRYSVESPESAVDVGKTGTVEFAVKPSGGLKINHDYPWKVTFEDVEGVEIASKTVGSSKIELADEQATIPVQLRANAAGNHKLSATGSFSVCNDTKCYVMRDEKVEFELAAAEAAEGGADEGAAEKKQTDEASDTPEE